MRYRYTLSEGYDKQIKQRLERVALYATPLAILLIVGVASLTNNTTVGPGIGSSGTGQGTVQTGGVPDNSMQNTANNGTGQNTGSAVQAQGSTTGTAGNSTANSSQAAAGSTAGGGVASTTPTTIEEGRGGDSTPSTSLQPAGTTPPTTTSPTTTTPTTPPSDDSGTTTIGQGLPVTICTKDLLNVCIN